MELKYLLREPQNITSTTPLLILLHGYGSNEEDLFSFISDLPSDWLVVSFRAPLDTDFGGYAWYNIDFNNPDNFIDTDQARQALKAIMEAIEKIKSQYNLTESNTHVAGFSQGGVLTYALALTYPKYFKKVVCMSTYPDPKLLTQISTNKKDFQHMTFFISHGAEDAVIPLEWGRKAADLLYDLSAYFTFREYMSGHGINQKNYMDLMEFFKK